MLLRDKLKLFYLRITKMSDDKKENIIKGIKSDETKMKMLSVVKDETKKINIIMTLQSDENKIKAMKQYIENPWLFIRIIESLNSYENKLANLHLLKYTAAKKQVLESIIVENDEQILRIVTFVEDDYLIVDFIKKIEDEKKKIEAISLLKSDFCKGEVIQTLQDDDKKITLLDEIADSDIRALIKISLRDREKLKEAFLDRNRIYTEIGLDKNMTIGIEIESEGKMSYDILKLRRLLKKQAEAEKSGWKTKVEDSLYYNLEDGLENGVEVVSPILTDNLEDVEDIYMVCEMLQSCGLYTSERCGGHIHIGADYLKCKEAYINLFEIWGNVEKIIYKISNEKSTLPRRGVQKFARPISTKLNIALQKGTINLESEEDLDQFISEIQHVQSDSKYFGVNLLNINNEKNTIEFRIPNGTINAETWIENIRLFGRIVQISQKLAEIEKQSELSQEKRKLLFLKNMLKKEEITEQEKMEILLELLFTEEERTVYRERYISCSKLLEQIPDEENPFKEFEFSQVDFTKKKHALGKFYDVTINDRTDEINEETR